MAEAPARSRLSRKAKDGAGKSPVPLLDLTFVTDFFSTIGMGKDADLSCMLCSAKDSGMVRGAHISSKTPRRGGGLDGRVKMPPKASFHRSRRGVAGKTAFSHQQGTAQDSSGQEMWVNDEGGGFDGSGAAHAVPPRSKDAPAWEETAHSVAVFSPCARDARDMVSPRTPTSPTEGNRGVQLSARSNGLGQQDSRHHSTSPRKGGSSPRKSGGLPAPRRESGHASRGEHGASSPRATRGFGKIVYKSNAELGIIMPGATAAHWEQFEAMTATASTPEAIKRFLRLKTIASREAMDSIYTTKRAPDVFVHTKVANSAYDVKVMSPSVEKRTSLKLTESEKRRAVTPKSRNEYHTPECMCSFCEVGMQAAVREDAERKGTCLFSFEENGMIRPTQRRVEKRMADIEESQHHLHQRQQRATASAGIPIKAEALVRERNMEIL